MKRVIHEPSFTCALVQGNLKDIQNRVYNTVYSSGSVSEDFSATSFYECMFKGVSFKGNMHGCLFQDVVFEHCDISNCDFSECVFRRVRFETCRMMGTDCSSSNFTDTVFHNCQCAYINLNSTKWKDARLERTLFCEGSFSMCTFMHTEPVHCDFSGCEFAHTPLKDIDFSNSEIDGFAVTPEDLKGAIVNADQAIACAKILGLKVLT